MAEVVASGGRMAGLFGMFGNRQEHRVSSDTKQGRQIASRHAYTPRKPVNSSDQIGWNLHVDAVKMRKRAAKLRRSVDAPAALKAANLKRAKRSQHAKKSRG